MAEGRPVGKFVALFRAAAAKSAGETEAFLLGLSESAQSEVTHLLLLLFSPARTDERGQLFAALLPEEESAKRHVCPVCHKRFARKWNCDRHLQKKHERGREGTCVFAGCDASGSAGELAAHEASLHGLAKRARKAVPHEDHLDLLLPSGHLLHMGEHGVERRAFDGGVLAEECVGLAVLSFRRFFVFFFLLFFFLLFFFLLPQARVRGGGGGRAAGARGSLGPGAQQRASLLRAAALHAGGPRGHSAPLGLEGRL